MSELEEDYTFSCPYCFSPISVRIDYTAGSRQSFVYDCEICCQPIAIRLELDSEGLVSFDADRENS